MLALRTAEPPSSSDHADATDAPEGLDKTTRAVQCAACGAVVTTIEKRCDVGGSHEHRFMNPAGHTFHIGCFADAIGCVIVGPDSLEYPWFPGFSWRYATCASCGQHLGWHFRDQARAGFFGLILNRLRFPLAED